MSYVKHKNKKEFRNHYFLKTDGSTYFDIYIFLSILAGYIN